jgi:hypothetical protein
LCACGECYARFLLAISGIACPYIIVSLWNRNLTLGNGFLAVFRKRIFFCDSLHVNLNWIESYLGCGPSRADAHRPSANLLCPIFCTRLQEPCSFTRVPYGL